MEALTVYIPTDRRHALARGLQLPERSGGAALFADISGFTPLTEALVRALGPQRGAEELPRQLNLIYDALIAEADRYGGSVIGFSGDAITCWFDDSFDLAALSAEPEPARAQTSAAHRAAACALAMQAAMRQFAMIEIDGAGSVALAIKVAVAAGPVRRFVVGDPAIQTIDVLAGATLNRLADAEHHADKGEVLLDEPAAAALGAGARLAEWRDDAETGARFAVLAELLAPPGPAPWPALDAAALTDTIVRPWLLPSVYARLQGGLGEFLTELRPAVALFLRFGGIDYDTDADAQPKLDAFILWVQGILARYESYILQLTIGDKGSYLYAAFGAPLAHEDDVVRAVAAALELRAPSFAYITGVQIGVSQGRMRTGAYGGSTRRTYGALGDEVNMAARLMQHAPPGQVLVSQGARKSTGDAFGWETLPPLRVKGKSQPAIVYRLIGRQARPAIRLQEPRYALPMVGRAAELRAIGQRLDQAIGGRGHIVAITAEAGMGKSRLVAEAVRLARARQVVGYGGECQSYGTNTSFLVWQNIWRGFFGLDPAWPAEAQIARLEAELRRIGPELLPRLPLLGAVLNLGIADTELTAGFDAQLRNASLQALLVSCLRARTADMPLLLVLEDCHWLDPLSHDLLEVIGRAIADMPVLLLLAYRPPQVQRLLAPKVGQLAHFSELPLTHLPEDEIAQLVQFKLGQVYGPGVSADRALAEQISARAQGNPFYVEELLNYLHDRGIDPQQPEAVAQIELPASLHSLILSRMDQLTENQQTLLKVASVIGRLFRAAMLWGVYRFFGGEALVRADLDILSELELTPLDTPDPELVYLFKHVVTQEVAYETLPFATRALLHEQIGQYIERSYADALDRYVDLLAYHYDRSQNADKRREYLLKAGAAAQAEYANAAAIDYYERALPLIEAAKQSATLIELGQVLEVVGQWAAADARYRQALALAQEQGDQRTQARAQALIGELLRKQGQYAQAGPWNEQARALYAAIGDRAGEAQVLHFAGLLAMHQGDYAAARVAYNASLAIRRELNDQPMIGSLLSNLSIVAFHLGDAAAAEQLASEALALRRAVGNKLWVANSLGNLGMLALEGGRYDEARAFMGEALALERVVGDRSAIAISLNNLGNLARDSGDYAAARELYHESLAISRELGDAWALCYLLEDLGCLAALSAAPDPALRLGGAAAALRESINAPLSPPEQASLDRKLGPAREAVGAELAAAAWAAGKALTADQAVALALAL